MTSTKDRIIKSSQEQATAAWINQLNQIRLDTFISNLDKQDINLEDALSELAELKDFIGDPSHILGSGLTKHGEIAEHMQVNISNARRAIQGLSKEYTFDGVGRLAPEDYLKNGQPIQSKFYNGLKQTFFNHHGIEDHIKTYDFFVRNGGSYDIPKDQYEQLVDILDKYHNAPSQLSRGDFYLAKQLDTFLKSHDLEVGKDIKSAIVKYKEAQINAADKTISSEEKSIRKEDANQRRKIYEKSKPSFKEGAKATGVSAGLEGGVAFCLSVSHKLKEKSFSQFSAEDWKDIGLDTGEGTVKGGIRGGSIYVLTNFTQTPANVASAFVTASFGVYEQVKALENGEVSKEDFVINCETVSLDVTVSAIASLIGTVAIPIPILGTVIGNVAGEFIYEICKNAGSRQSQLIIEGYQKEMAILNQQLDAKLYQVLFEIKEELERFKCLEEFAFDEDVNVRFLGSIRLAKDLGVEGVLTTKEHIDNYFLS